ncbi:MAG: hypothetical protein LBU32_13610 [Clostridiales bacterium]|nr:hypothetical protein [Clostridiales bacterium]
MEKVFEQYNICLVSPLWYTKLAKEILDRHNISLDSLFESSILGEIIENYVKGSYFRFNPGVNYHLYKIGNVSDKRTNLARLTSQEVDLFDPKHKLLCELSKGNNKRQHNLMKHYSNIPYIRILSSEDEESTKWGINKIAFPRLCAMVDTGEIFSLEKTVNTSQKDKRAESISNDQSSTISVDPYE